MFNPLSYQPNGKLIASAACARMQFYANVGGLTEVLLF